MESLSHIVTLEERMPINEMLIFRYLCPLNDPNDGHGHVAEFFQDFLKVFHEP